MDFSVSVSSAAKEAALQKALLAYNASAALRLSEQEFLQKLIDGQLDGLVSAYLVTTITKLAFLNRFTAEERIGIRAAAAQSPVIADYLAMLDAASGKWKNATFGIPSVSAAPTAAPSGVAAGSLAMVFCTADKKLYTYTGSAWVASAAFA